MHEPLAHDRHHTWISSVARAFFIAILVGASCLLIVPCVLIILSLVGLVPSNWMKEPVSGTTLWIIVAIAGFVAFTFPARKIARGDWQGR